MQRPEKKAKEMVGVREGRGVLGRRGREGEGVKGIRAGRGKWRCRVALPVACSRLPAVGATGSHLIDCIRVRRRQQRMQ